MVRKDLPANALVVAQGRNHPLLSNRLITVERLRWIHGPPEGLERGLRLSAKTRYRHRDGGCVARTLNSGRCLVRFDQPEWAVTPGQYLVFYDGEEWPGRRRDRAGRSVACQWRREGPDPDRLLISHQPLLPANFNYSGEPCRRFSLTHHSHATIRTPIRIAFYDSVGAVSI